MPSTLFIFPFMHHAFQCQWKNSLSSPWSQRFSLCLFLSKCCSLVKWSEVKVTQLCPTFCDPMDYTVHGILQARILEWVAFPFSRGSSQPRDRTQVSCIAGRFFTIWATRETRSIFNTQESRFEVWLNRKWGLSENKDCTIEGDLFFVSIY